MNKIFSTFFALAFSLSAWAQTANISGKIIDETTGMAIEFANVLAMKAGTNEMINGVITNEKGEFVLNRLPFGNCYIKVTFIGYKEFKSEEITLGARNNNVKMSVIKLSSESQNLEAVEIVGEKRLMEYQIDKRVVNVEQNIVNDGGTAVDVLSNVSSVSVDAEGNISLKGSTNVTVLVDGRPMELSGLGLDQIAASTIEAVELISNPSAKYDPEGMTGIINIKTKKRVTVGINGLVNASASTSGRANLSTNVNLGREKVNFFTNIGINRFAGKNRGESTTVTTFPSEQLHLFLNAPYSYRNEYQSSTGERDGLGGNAKFGVDWKMNTYNSLTASVDLQTWGGGRENASPKSVTSYYNQSDSMRTAQWMAMNNESNFRQYSAITNLSYRKTTSRPREEFTLDVMVNVFRSNSESDNTRRYKIYNDLVTNPTTPSEWDNTTRQITDGGGNGLRSNIQANYIYPLGEKGKIETGYQGNIRPVNNKSDFTVNNAYNPDLSYDFEFIQQAHGIYGLWADEIGKWGFQLGGRMEYAESDGTTTVPEGSINSDTSFTYSYFRFYPTVHLSRKIDETQELQLSYSRRVNRPREHDLNPFRDMSNYPFSIEYGNPELIPEDVHSLELNHSKYWKSTSLYTNIYYRRVNNVIRDYSFLDANGILNETEYNYASGTNYGVDLTLEQALTKWWRVNANGNFYRNITKGDNNTSTDASLNSEGYSYSFRVNSAMNFPQNLSVQVSGRFNGPRYRGQEEMLPNWGAEIAIRKGFNKNKWSVGLRVSDIFNTQKWGSTTQGADFVTNSERKMLTSRALYVSVSYKINQGARPQKQEKRGVSVEGESEGGEE